MWMLFPKEEELIEWFQKAGFQDVKIKRIGPKWYRGVRCHGLIMGCSVTGVKRASSDSPLQLGPKAEDVEKPVNPFPSSSASLSGQFALLTMCWYLSTCGPKIRLFQRTSPFNCYLMPNCRAMSTK